uniref:TATA box-binding protein-associated factor RNA polymerase I subunit B n=1 Tax=Iconisemion striatum TaxID=60296 RepID=A0A1A7YTY5_9TELE
MDEDATAGYREPCVQCAAVNWGISEEGRFYCLSCHNVIERTIEVVDVSSAGGSNRLKTIAKRPRTSKEERGYTWVVCEGFQFILKNQADALLRLGVDPNFKDVLCQMWRLYLQKSQQAYTSKLLHGSRFRPLNIDSESDCATESSIVSLSERESNPSSFSEINSDGSGSAHSTNERTRQKRNRLMSMGKTLALLHLALMWSREALTLSDLLRLVKDGHVPYLNAYEQFPEEMKLSGNNSDVFNTKNIPSHHMVHKVAQSLVLVLELPAFPPVGPESLLHPALLGMRYLADTNLPDELHRWVCRLMERTQESKPEPSPVLPRYDLQAAAHIIVTMKLIFGLDDHTEWDLSNKVTRYDPSENLFSFRRWFRLMETTLIRAGRGRDRDTARKQWKPKKPIFVRRRLVGPVMKTKRIAEQLQMCFEKLSSCPSGVQDVTLSSFRFCWGDQDGSDGPSLHHMKLDGVVSLEDDVLTPLNSSYWHPGLRRCKMMHCQRSTPGHYPEFEPSLPRSFVWLLRLFGFLLDVEPCYLFEEVLEVERRLVGSRLPWQQNKRRLRDRTDERKRNSKSAIKAKGKRGPKEIKH